MIENDMAKFENLLIRRAELLGIAHPVEDFHVLLLVGVGITSFIGHFSSPPVSPVSKSKIHAAACFAPIERGSAAMRIFASRSAQPR